MSTDDKFKPLTKAQEKLVNASITIFEDAANANDVAFMARQLIQVTLPHKNPGDVQVWNRRNGNTSLVIQPGFNHKKGKSYGYPYGSIPRLLLFWMITEAVRTKCPRLELGHSFNDFIAELGLNPNRGGKRSDANRLRDQMERLFNAFISFSGDLERDNSSAEARLNMAVASKTLLWWNPKQSEQGVLWGSWIELGKDFYEALIAAPVPVDMRALQALKKSPLALDLYAWLVYESFRAHKSGKARFEAWEKLHSHLGGEYAHIQHFRAKAKSALVKIKLVFPGLRLGSKQGGIEILPQSFPALQPRGELIIKGKAKPVEAPIPVGSFRAPLKDVTLERFRTRFGRLDPYACQADFEVWLATKPAKQQPRNYDAAFLGFAAKWSVDKL